MKTDSFFRQYRHAFFMLIGEDWRKARRYKFAAVEIKELAFRFDGLFLAASRKDDAYFVEVQFKKDPRFYSRFFAEIYVYLAQFSPANEWRAVAIFPTRALDPGVSRHYRELFNEGRVLRIYLDELPEATLRQFPLNLLQIILDKKQNVLSTVGKIAQRLPAEIPQASAQESFIELMVNLLLSKFPELTRTEIEKMVEPLISNVKKSRFYRELREETAQELTPKIEQEIKRKIARELLLRKMNLELIAEATQLAPREVRTIMKNLAARKSPV